MSGEIPWHIDPPGDETTVRTVHRAGKDGCEAVKTGKTVPVHMLRRTNEGQVRELVERNPHLRLCLECLKPCPAIRRDGRYFLPCVLTGPHDEHQATHYAAADGDLPAMAPLPETTRWSDPP